MKKARELCMLDATEFCLIELSSCENKEDRLPKWHVAIFPTKKMIKISIHLHPLWVGIITSFFIPKQGSSTCQDYPKYKTGVQTIQKKKKKKNGNACRKIKKW